MTLKRHFRFIRSLNSIIGIAKTHIVDGGKAELQRERRQALREVLLLLLRIELILVWWARVLSHELVHYAVIREGMRWERGEIEELGTRRS